MPRTPPRWSSAPRRSGRPRASWSLGVWPLACAEREDLIRGAPEPLGVRLRLEGQREDANEAFGRLVVERVFLCVGRERVAVQGVLGAAARHDRRALVQAD